MNKEIICDFDNGLLYRMKGDKLVEIGSLNKKKGCLEFTYNKKTHIVHRYLYEKYHNIELETSDKIIHLNGINNDNRITNLEKTNHQSVVQRTPRTNGTGYRGVYRGLDKYYAQITYNNKTNHLGFYDTKEEAYEAYKKTARELNEKCGCRYLID